MESMAKKSLCVTKLLSFSCYRSMAIREKLVDILIESKYFASKVKPKSGRKPQFLRLNPPHKEMPFRLKTIF